MKRLLLLGISGLLAGCAGTPLQPTDKPSDASFSSKTNPNWRVYNGLPATSKFWDINQLQPLSSGIGTFPFQKFVNATSGSFAIYLLLNYNYDITDKTIATTFHISGSPGTFSTRNTDPACSGAFVRLEFQDVSAGPYDSNDYWWSTDALDLQGLANGSFDVSTADRTHWTNQAGKSATDETAPWTDWTGATVTTSPYDGFTKARKNVKQLGLSFGSPCTYASGVATANTDAAFDLLTFTVQ